MITGMTDPVVVVTGGAGDPGAGTETGEVAAAVTEAVGDAFRQGVSAGEEAVRIEQHDTVSRAEFDALAREVEELRGAAAVAVGTAQAAAEIALETADQVDAGDAGADAPGDDGEPRPPEPRAEPEPAAETTAPAKHTGYGAAGWYGKRG